MLETALNLIISNAYAADAATPPQSSSLSFFIMMAVFMGFIYFAIWRPQSKRAREQQNLLNSIAVGDEIMTAGGILGKVNKISDQYIVVEIADKVEMTMQKSSVINVLPKGTIKSIA